MTHYNTRNDKIQVRYHEGASKLERHGVMMDLAASETVEFKQGEVKVIPLGVSVKLPDNMWGLVVPRSSTCLKHGIMMANSAGVIENDYCGNGDVWGFVAYAVRDTTIEQGTRIAQFMPVKYADWDSLTLEEVDSMPYPDRGGYGSTDKAEPKPLDRYGREIHVGDWVAVDGSSFKVLGFEESAYSKSRACAFAQLEGGRVFNANVLTLCPLGADGKPLLIGETVYDQIGVPMEITTIEEDSAFARRADFLDWEDWIESIYLTHEMPHTWEKLEDCCYSLVMSEYLDDPEGDVKALMQRIRDFAERPIRAEEVTLKIGDAE